MKGIYKITNKLNGKSYIGQSIHCGKRLDEHFKGSQFIDEVLQLEGIENFEFEVLKEVKNNEDLNKWEDFYIIKFNTIFPNGYNKRFNLSLKEREKLIKECEIERSSIELPLTIPLGIVKGEKGIREELREDIREVLGEGEFKGEREKKSLKFKSFNKEEYGSKVIKGERERGERKEFKEEEEFKGLSLKIKGEREFKSLDKESLKKFRLKRLSNFCVSGKIFKDFKEKSLERYFYAPNYETKEKSKLTKKQFLVYTYLLANSKWNANSDERHYYIYFNSFTVSGAAQQIGISRPTWNSAIEKLRKENLIIKMDGKRQITLEHEKEEPSLKFSGDHYRITFPETNAPLNIKLISYLLEFSLFLNNSGNIVGVYSTLYQYWNSCMNNNSKCCISINQLLKLFETNYNKIAGKYYEMLMCLFSALGLISLKMTKKFYMGQSYTEYEILFMNVSIPDNLEAKSYGPDDIEEIIKAIENSI